MSNFPSLESLPGGPVPFIKSQICPLRSLCLILPTRSDKSHGTGNGEMSIAVDSNKGRGRRVASEWLCGLCAKSGKRTGAVLRDTQRLSTEQLFTTTRIPRRGISIVAFLPDWTSPLCRALQLSFTYVRQHWFGDPGHFDSDCTWVGSSFTKA